MKLKNLLLFFLLVNFSLNGQTPKNKAQQLLDSSWNYSKINIKKAELFLQKGYALSILTKDSIALSQYYYTSSKICHIKGDYEKALKDALMGEKIATLAHQNLWIAKNNLRQAAIYFVAMKDVVNSNKKANVALLYMKRANASLVNYTGIYEQLKFVSFYEKKYEKSLLYAKKQQNINLQVGNMSQYYYEYQFLAYIYEKQNNQKELKKCISVLEQNYKKITPREREVVFHTLAVQYADQNNLDKAIYYADLFSKCDFGKSAPEIVIEEYKAMAEIYSKKKNFEKALYYVNKSSKLKDSTLNTQHIAKIAEMETKFKLKEKEQAIKELELTNTLEENQKQIITLYAIIVTICLITFVGLSYWIRKRKELEKKEVLLLLNEEKQYVRDILFNQTKKIEEENDRLIQFIQEKIASDIHDGLSNSIAKARLTLNHLSLKAINDKEKENLRAAEEIVAELYTEARDFSHHLKNGVNQTVYSLIDFLNQIETSINNNSQFKIKLYADKEELNNNLTHEQQQQLFFVLKEGITNVMKHSLATLININIQLTDTSCKFTIMDNGQQDLINIQNKGIGIENMKTRMAAINGNINLYRKNSLTILEGEFEL